MYAILLNEQQELDLEKTARILAKAENLVYGDATRAVRTCTGILARNLPYNEAETIANELSANGVGCFVLAMADFYHPLDAHMITGVELSPGAFGVMDLYGRVQPVPWSDVVLLCLGHIAEERRERFTLGDQTADRVRTASFAIGLGLGVGAMGLARPSSHELPKKQPKVGAKYALDVFAYGPVEGHWRIEHNGFNYSCLGPSRRNRAEENFPLLVNEIVQRATSSYCNRGLNAFLGGMPERAYTYDGIKHFDEENLWLLQKVVPNLPNR
jgi:hypothetical protein